MLFPFHNYLGPGNDADNGAPVDSDDEIARVHDLAYEAATRPEQVRQADEEAIMDFERNYTSTGNWHSAAGAVGLTFKYEVESVTGVLYPPVGGPWQQVMFMLMTAYRTGRLPVAVAELSEFV